MASPEPTDHPLATQAGDSVLESGGNAVDAAIAANLVLAVVRPHMYSAQTIFIDPENGFLSSGADSRRQAYAIGS